MKNNKKFKLEDLPSYKHASQLSKTIWKIVEKWSFVAQKTVGLQIIRSFDSIAANIAEGFGRFHKKDKIKFFYNARASAYESAHWTKIALERNLLTKQEYDQIMELLRLLPKEINYLIKYTQLNLKI